MRIRPLLLIAGLAALTLGAGAADARCAPPVRHKLVHRPACPCVVRRRPVVVHHCLRHERPQVQAQVDTRHYGYVERHGWSDAHSWSDERSQMMVMAWQDRRPWDTDRFGYLTWPGKTHFVDGHPVDGAALPPPPPPPPGAMGPDPMQDGAGPPPPPPPGADEQGPGPDEGPGYEVHRY